MMVPELNHEPNSPMRIIYPKPGGRGWDPITIMVRLAAYLFNADLIELNGTKTVTRLRKTASLIPRRHGIGTCLIIAPNPSHLNAILHLGHWTKGYAITAAWIIDSFWIDRLPKVATSHSHFDRFYITDGELIDDYKQLTGIETRYLPWGTDALNFGSANAHRPVDLLRIGRQPTEWENDDESKLAANAIGISFGGRPPFSNSSPSINHRRLLSEYSRAKFTLSFTNLRSPSDYTHPTRDYITARWLDALASGAVVAGIPPGSKSAADTLWPGAVLDLGDTNLNDGLQIIKSGLDQWNPTIALHNYRQSLLKNDWRHRFRVIADDFSIDAPRLTIGLDQLNARVDQLSA